MRRRSFIKTLLPGAMLALVLTHTAVAATKLQEYYEQAEQAYNQGDYKKAVAYYEQAVETDPNFAPAYNGLGLARLAASDRLTEVIWCFKEALDIDPNYTDAYANLCKAYYQSGRHDEAEQSCKKALSIDPNMLSVKLNLAWIYLLGKKQYDQAITYFQQVLEKLKNPTVYFGLGSAYAAKGDRAKVLEIVTTLRTRGENNLASQLENSIRTAESRSPPGQTPEMPESQPGTLIRAEYPQPPAPPADSAVSGSSLMRIRLRGKLQSVPKF